MSETSARKLLAEQRRARAIEMRLRGYSYSKIGKELGVSAAAAHKMIKTAMERDRKRTAKAAEAYRELERQRLEMMILALMGDALAGDVSAVREVRNLSESIRELLGLDAPDKSDITAITADVVSLGSDVLTDDERIERLAQILDAARARRDRRAADAD